MCFTLYAVESTLITDDWSGSMDGIETIRGQSDSSEIWSVNELALNNMENVGRECCGERLEHNTI